jgi:hypothetical protein
MKFIFHDSRRFPKISKKDEKFKVPTPPTDHTWNLLYALRHDIIELWVGILRLKIMERKTSSFHLHCAKLEKGNVWIIALLLSRCKNHAKLHQTTQSRAEDSLSRLMSNGEALIIRVSGMPSSSQTITLHLHQRHSKIPPRNFKLM